MSDKTSLTYIRDILNSIEEIEDFTEGLTYEEFAEDTKTINAVVRSLEVMGEATKNVPDSIRSDYPEIPWKSMAGMRDNLIHEYSGVDLGIVWKTIQNNISEVKPLIEKIEQDLEE